MAKPYQASVGTNRFMGLLVKLGVGRTELLTTTGRKSGEKRQVPVSPIEVDGTEYLVAPYGPVGWVLNLRADPEATLRHGRTERVVTLEEVTGPEVAPVVAGYYAREGYSRPYMDVPEDPSVSDFADRADSFPVFRVGSGRSL